MEAMIMPGVQYPHCSPCASWKACCIGCQSPFSMMPCTVVISCPSACTARIVHDLTDSPSSKTVHAPQLVVSQPECTPPIPRFSLRWWMSNSRGSTSATCALPSTVIWILRTYPPFPESPKKGSTSYPFTRDVGFFSPPPDRRFNELVCAAFPRYSGRFCRLPLSLRRAESVAQAAFFVHISGPALSLPEKPLKETFYERTENRRSGSCGEAQGRGRDPRGLGCAGRGGARRGRAARPRRASALELERHLPADRRDPRGGAVRRLGCAAGALAHQGGRRRLRYRGGRGQKPDRRGRARDRQLPGLLPEHPLGAGGPHPRERPDRRPVRHRQRRARGLYERGRVAARRARGPDLRARRFPRGPAPAPSSSPAVARPAGLAVHVDVDEVSLGRGVILVVSEDADLIADAAVAQPGDAKARVHGVGEGERFEIAALRLDDQADDPALLDVEGSRGDQVPVHDRVEVRVVDDVVDVAVDVVVHPAGRDRKEPPVPIPRLRRLPTKRTRIRQNTPAPSSRSG